MGVVYKAEDTKTRPDGYSQIPGGPSTEGIIGSLLTPTTQAEIELEKRDGFLAALAKPVSKTATQVFNFLWTADGPRGLAPQFGVAAVKRRGRLIFREFGDAIGAGTLEIHVNMPKPLIRPL